MSNFSEILKYLRNRSNLTQEELASKLKISKSSISMYERGQREPDFELLELIADFFNVDMNFLLGENDNLKNLDKLCMHLGYCRQNKISSFIDKYFQLDDSDRNAVNTLIDGLSKADKYKEKKKEKAI